MAGSRLVAMLSMVTLHVALTQATGRKVHPHHGHETMTQHPSLMEETTRHRGNEDSGASRTTHVRELKGCKTRKDERVKSWFTHPAKPGSACLVGVDPADEGKHCIHDTSYGSNGWCWTKADKTEWGSCDDGCPLMDGNLKIEKKVEKIAKAVHKLASEAAAGDSDSEALPEDDKKDIDSHAEGKDKEDGAKHKHKHEEDKQAKEKVEAKGGCATIKDERAVNAWSQSKLAKEGTPCHFGADDRDEGTHCIPEHDWGSRGWCWTDKDKTSWGPCNKHCPLYGRHSVLGGEVQSLESKVSNFNKDLTKTIHKLEGKSLEEDGKKTAKKATKETDADLKLKHTGEKAAVNVKLEEDEDEEDNEDEQGTKLEEKKDHEKKEEGRKKGAHKKDKKDATLDEKKGDEKKGEDEKDNAKKDNDNANIGGKKGEEKKDEKKAGKEKKGKKNDKTDAKLVDVNSQRISAQRRRRRSQAATTNA